MDAKPKRKNTSDSETIEFVTTLSLYECVDRLERAAARTLEHRVDVRVSGRRFVAEVEAEITKREPKRVVAKLSGELYTSENNHTRVRARYHNRNPYKPNDIILYAVLMALGMGFSCGFIVGLNDPSSGIVIGIVSGIGFFFWSHALFERRSERIEREIPNFNRWLRKHLDAPGS